MEKQTRGWHMNRRHCKTHHMRINPFTVSAGAIDSGSTFYLHILHHSSFVMNTFKYSVLFLHRKIGDSYLPKLGTQPFRRQLRDNRWKFVFSISFWGLASQGHPGCGVIAQFVNSCQQERTAPWQISFLGAQQTYSPRSPARKKRVTRSPCNLVFKLYKYILLTNFVN